MELRRRLNTTNTFSASVVTRVQISCSTPLQSLCATLLLPVRCLWKTPTQDIKTPPIIPEQ